MWAPTVSDLKSNCSQSSLSNAWHKSHPPFRAFLGAQIGSRQGTGNHGLRSREHVKATQSEVVTDQAVPEGHKGLHEFLYGEGGAEAHDFKQAQTQAREVIYIPQVLYQVALTWKAREKTRGYKLYSSVPGFGDSFNIENSLVIFGQRPGYSLSEEPADANWELIPK